MSIDFGTPDFWPEIEALKIFENTRTGLFTGTAGPDQRKLRLAIRNFLFRKFPNEFDSEDAVKDLSKRPIGKTAAFSISHSHSAAGVLVSFSDVPNQSIGFDIEQTGRVTEAVAVRVGSAAELSGAPSATHLWAAKEAFYKSIPVPKQPAQPKRLQISDWRQISPRVHSFKAELAAADGTGTELDCEGVTVEHAGSIYAFTRGVFANSANTGS